MSERRNCDWVSRASPGSFVGDVTPGLFRAIAELHRDLAALESRLAPAGGKKGGATSQRTTNTDALPASNAPPVSTDAGGDSKPPAANAGEWASTPDAVARMLFGKLCNTVGSGPKIDAIRKCIERRDAEKDAELATLRRRAEEAEAKAAHNFRGYTDAKRAYEALRHDVNAKYWEGVRRDNMGLREKYEQAREHSERLRGEVGALTQQLAEAWQQHATAVAERDAANAGKEEAEKSRDNYKDDFECWDKRLKDALDQCRCPDCKCGDQVEAESSECGCDSPICARPADKTLAEWALSLLDERDAANAGREEAEKGMSDIWEAFKIAWTWLRTSNFAPPKSCGACGLPQGSCDSECVAAAAWSKDYGKMKQVAEGAATTPAVSAEKGGGAMKEKA